MAGRKPTFKETPRNGGNKVEISFETPNTRINEYDENGVQVAIHDLIHALGYHPDSENFKDTPERVARMYKELLEGEDEGDLDIKQFTGSSDLIVADGIKSYGICPHHLLPVKFTSAVAYLPEGKVIGVSKLVRVVYKNTRRIVLQEKVVEDVATELQKITGSEHVFVLVHGEHLCMKMRGVKNDADITAVAIRGKFRDNPSLKAEVYEILNHRR